MKFLLSLLVLSHFVSCDSLIRNDIYGEIVPIWTDHSYKGNFLFTEDSHVVIDLYSEEHSDSTSTIKSHTITNITKFPISYSIPFPENVDEKKLRISAKVLSGKEDTAKIGDFTTETVTPVQRGAPTTIQVVGRESCSAAHSGGYCNN